MNADLDSRLRSALRAAADELPTPDLDPAGAVRRGRSRQNRARFGAGLAGLVILAGGTAALTRVLDDGSERIVTGQPGPEDTTTSTAPPVTSTPTAAPEGALGDLAGGWVAVVDHDLIWRPAGEDLAHVVVTAALTPGHEDLGGFSEQLLLRNVVELDGDRLALYEVIDYRVVGEDGTDRLEAFDLDTGRRTVVSERDIDTRDGTWQYVTAAGVRGDHLGLQISFHQGRCHWLEEYAADGTPVTDPANPYPRPDDATLAAMAGGDLSGCPSAGEIAVELGLLPSGRQQPGPGPTTSVPATTTTADLPTPTTIVPPGEETTTTATAPVTAPPTATTMPGEDFDTYVPEPGDGLAVTGIAWDDILNVREGPGVGYPVIATFEPTSVGVVAGGDGRLLDGSIWWSVQLGDRVGWVNARYVSRVGRAKDITASVHAALGDPAVAETGLDLATAIGGDSIGDEWGQTVVVQGAEPRQDGTSEMIVDLVGLHDDAVGTVRLRLVLRDSSLPELVELVSAESTAMCSRGVTADGVCA